MLTRIAPILAVAYCTIIHSAQFGAQMPIRSPVVTPTASRARGPPVDVGSQRGIRPAAALRHVDEGLAVTEPSHRLVEVVADRLLDKGGLRLAAGVREGGVEPQ